MNSMLNPVSQNCHSDAGAMMRAASFDRRKVMCRWRLVVEFRRFDRQPLEPGPGEHPKVFRLAAGQLVDLADKLR